MSMPLSYAASGFGLFVIVTVSVFTALSLGPSAPFFWHPITMTIAFLFFMVQGILTLISKHGFFNFEERASKLQAHFWCQNLAVLCYTVGFISIIYNKFAKGSFHFTTWHSWFGLVCGIVCYSQLLLGLYLYYTWPKLLVGKVWTQKPKDLTVKRWHRTLAVIGFALGIITCIVAMWSSFVAKSFPSEISNMLVVALIVVGASAALIGLRIELPEWMQ